MNLQDLFAMFGGGDQNAAAVNRGIDPMMGPSQGSEGGSAIDSIGQFLSGLMGGQAQAPEPPPAPPIDQNTAKLRALLAVSKANPEDVFVAEGDTISKGDNGKLVRGSFSKSLPPAVKEGYSSGEKADAIDMAKNLGLDGKTAKLMAKQATDSKGKFDFKEFQQGVESHARAQNYAEQVSGMISDRKDKKSAKDVQNQFLFAPDTASRIKAIQDFSKLSGGQGASIPTPDIQERGGFMSLLSQGMGGLPSYDVKNQDAITAAIEALVAGGGALTPKGQANPLTMEAIQKYLESLYQGK